MGNGRQISRGWSVAVALVALVARPVGARAIDHWRSGDPRQRAAAARRAGERGDRTALDRLIELLRDDSVSVRLAAVQALSRLGDEAALRPLMVAAQSDFDARVRLAAARAVLKLDPRAYAAKLGTADPPPVQPGAPPAPPLPRPQRAVFGALGLMVDSLAIGAGPDGLVAAGLRWPRWELQLGLVLPAVGLRGQARCNLLVESWLVPFVGAGYAVLYRGDWTPAVALLFGGGVRVQITPRLFGQLEVWGSRVVLRQRTVGGNSPGKVRSPDRWALPVLVGLGWEFWL